MRADLFTSRLRRQALTCCLAVLTATVPGLAQETSEPAPKLKRVEEDWVVLIRNPDWKIASPQVLVCMSPNGLFNEEYGLMEINHASKPSWFAGGIQMQGWRGELNTALYNAPKTQVLTSDYDRLTFTTAMEITADGHTEFSIINGKSRTWGTFGNSGNLKVKVPTTRTDLSEYTRESSVKNTHVTHGAHRVSIMYQRRARYYYDDNTSVTDDSYRILHRYHSLIQEITLDEWEANKEYYNVESPGDGS